MYCNNNFSGKYWAIFDPELFGPPENPDKQGPDYRGTTVYVKIYTLRFFGCRPPYSGSST